MMARPGTSAAGAGRRAAGGTARWSPIFAFVSAVHLACGGEAPPLPPPISIEAIVDSLLPAVERVSALRSTGPVAVGTRSAQDVIAFVQSRLDIELPEAELEGSRITYEMLGLLPANYKLRQQLLAIYAEQIVGFYDPETKTLYAVESVPPEALKPVLAHELVHALQDQHVNLDSLISGDRGSDRQIAAQAAIEGHATLAMLAWAMETASGQPVSAGSIPDVAGTLRANFDAQPSSVLSRAPRIIRDGLIFPYASGASFVQALWQRPGTAPVAPFGPLMPQSTEQVIQPAERFIDSRDEPTELRFDSMPDWTVRYEDTMGAFTTTIFTEENAGVYGAEGWDGDRLRLIESATGARAILWSSIWDDAGAADRFATTVRSIVTGEGFARTGRVVRDSLEGRPIVHVGIADADSVLAALPAVTVHCATAQGQPAPCAATAAADSVRRPAS